VNQIDVFGGKRKSPNRSTKSAERLLQKRRWFRQA